MDKDLALATLVEITNNNLGHVPSSPTEFNELSRMIQQKTGRQLSLSSIKRIWGYVRYDSFPSATTLNTLAQYNDYKDWDSFMASNPILDADDSDDSGFLQDSMVNVNDLKQGDHVLLSWGKSKSCEIEYLGERRFRVADSHNIKLLQGDVFTLHTICVGHPIYVSDIRRDNMILPAYIGAKKGGLTTITLLP